MIKQSKYRRTVTVSSGSDYRAYSTSDSRFGSLSGSKPLTGSTSGLGSRYRSWSNLRSRSESN